MESQKEMTDDLILRTYLCLGEILNEKYKRKWKTEISLEIFYYIARHRHINLCDALAPMRKSNWHTFSENIVSCEEMKGGTYALPCGQIACIYKKGYHDVLGIRPN